MRDHFGISIAHSAAVIISSTLLLSSSIADKAHAVNSTIDCRAYVETKADWPADYGPLVTALIGPHKFRVPDKYFSVIVAEDAPTKDNKWENLGFSFWFPDLCPTKQRFVYALTYRPYEPDRSELQSDSFVVKIASVSYVTNLERTPTPLKQYNNIQKYRIHTFDVGQEFGLIKLTSKDADYPNDVYFDQNASERELLIKCTRKTQARGHLVNPSCTARLYMVRQRLYLTYHYPYDARDRWSEIEQSLNSLLGRFVPADGTFKH